MAAAAKVAYARVSSQDQNLDRQLEAFKLITPDRIFTDKLSGKNIDRPGFQDMMDYVRDGDHLYVASMDRLARNLKDLLEVTESLQKKGVAVHFLKENISLDPTGDQSPIAKLLLSMMGAVAEFERSLIRERQAEGIAIAKTRGVYKGPLDVILPFATPSTFHGVAKHAIFAGVQRQRRSAPAEQGAQHL